MSFPVRAYDDPRKGTADKFYCARGGYIQDFRIDPSGFQISEEVILRMDDGFQWSLHVARESSRTQDILGDRGPGPMRRHPRSPLHAYEGKGSIWKDNLWIYEVRNVAVCLEEAEPE